MKINKLKMFTKLKKKLYNRVKGEDNVVTEQWYFIGGTLCRKEKEFSIANIKVDVYRCGTFYFVFLGDNFAYEFKAQEQINIDGLVEFILKETINRWETSDDIRKFSRKLFQTSNPNGNMINEYENMMKCKKRLQEIINQYFIDSLKTFLIMSA
jgi:hypothetical protein